MQISKFEHPDAPDEKASENVRRQVCQDGATIPRILDLARSCASETVIKHALRRLDERIVGTKNCLFKAIAGMCGAPAFVASCMSRFPTSRDITYEALRCIIDLCQRSVAPQNARDFQDVGVFDLIVNMLQPKSPWQADFNILGYAIGALRALCLLYTSPSPRD